MKSLKYITIFSSILVCAGCATYVPPVSGPMATITGTSVTSYGIFQNARLCTKPVGLSSNKANKISAGRLNTFIAGGPPGPCPILVFSFVPKVNHSYQVSYDYKSPGLMKALIKNGKCIFKLTNLTTNQPVRPIIRNYYITPIIATTTRCKDQLAQ